MTQTGQSRLAQRDTNISNLYYAAMERYARLFIEETGEEPRDHKDIIARMELEILALKALSIKNDESGAPYAEG